MKSYQIPWLSAPILGMKMLEVKNLSVAYGKHQALMDVSLRVGKEEIVVILGANGAGKSSLLRAIGGISEGKVSGQIEMDGYPILEQPPHEIVTHGIALVPEGRGIFGDLSVRDNLRLGAYTERAQEEETTNLERVFNLFPKLAERKNQIANTMSGGEQQMVAIGRSMMSNPAILLLDEPSLGLSPLLSKELFASLRRIRESGIGILLVEQNAKQSLAIADRGYLLENAKIVHEDRAEVLVSDPAVQKAYLGRGGSQQASISNPKPLAAHSERGISKSRTGDPKEIALAALASLQSKAIREESLPQDSTPSKPVPPPLSLSSPLIASTTQKNADELANLSISELVSTAAAAARRIPLDPIPDPPTEIFPAQLRMNEKACVAHRSNPKQVAYSDSLRKAFDAKTHDERLKAVLSEITASAEASRNRIRHR